MSGHTPAAHELGVDILGLTLGEFIAHAAERGMRTPRATACYRAAFRDGRAAEPWITIARPPIVRTERDAGAWGETVKFVQRHDDGLETESVLIPMRHRNAPTTRTICVSSQVGCAMGCVFCETAQMGLLKNLTAAQIVAQWFAARHERPADRETIQPALALKNMVFMGMGEPMDNLSAVIQAIRVLCERDGPGMASSNIAVSTVGRVEGIRRFGEFIRERGFHRCNLAVSLNAPNDEIRSSIMPINRKHPMAALREAMLDFPLRPSSAICVEYVLIPGVNDALEHCDELCDYLRPVRCSLNVIPYNPRRNSPWPAPSEESVDRFMRRAVERGQFVKRRQTKGRGVMGACGQLGNEEIRHRKRVERPLGLTIDGRAPEPDHS
jgi:23S rRNA (adenine2503-C2)-methyltransferase